MERDDPVEDRGDGKEQEVRKGTVKVEESAKNKRTRSEPPDIDDPYKEDIIYAQVLAKYEILLENHQELRSENIEPPPFYEKPASDDEDLTKLLLGLDPDMDQEMLL
jgi:hypothetical protein